MVYGFVYIIIGGMFSPQIYTGEEAKAPIEGFFGIALPPSTTDFYYKYEGFQDYMIDIRLTLPPQDASSFIRAYLEKVKGKYPDYEFSNSRTYSYGVRDSDSHEHISYDEESRRLSVYLNTW